MRGHQKACGEGGRTATPGQAPAGSSHAWLADWITCFPHKQATGNARARVLPPGHEAGPMSLFLTGQGCVQHTLSARSSACAQGIAQQPT